ncbi:Ninein [Tupaia chinensis]|uniref:Ninein n=1 Tax=Tupaia chinensis TaxID=246437 RepID=L9J9M1_TUPCH|nr:Ninein [Tupaia chinensis]
MDEVEQDQHEARLKELFDSFDTTGTGSLGQEELTDLCHMLSLEEVTPVLQQTLLQDNLLGRVHFDQFKEALILILSRTLSNEDHFQEPDCSLEAQPKYVRGGKRYGRRSLPEFQESVEEFAEVTVIEPLDEEARPSHISASDCNEHWKTQRSEEYEAEGQLRFWNPDDLNASQSGTAPPQDWIEEKLQEVCEDLGIARDGHLNRKELVSICEQYGLQSVDGESFDESGRRTTTPSAMTGSIGFRVFSCLDDGMGHASVERILDTWQEEGIENSQEILKALDFSLDGNVNLAELTLALENELLVTKNSIHHAALASFKAEIRHLLERVDQVVREKEKLRSDLDKAEKLKSLMASEVDDHHAAIEQRNEYNLRKLDEEYKERIAALKNELRKEREQLLQQVGKQRFDLEQELEKAKTEENYIRDRLALSLKENSRLENELLENAEKLAEYENLTNKLQRNLENVLAEKFGDLDPSSAEFFLQEERLAQMRNEYEQQCRVRLSEKQLDETLVTCEKEQEHMKQKYEAEMHTLKNQISDLEHEITNLRGQAVVLKEAHEEAACRHEEEIKQLQMKFDEEKTCLQEKLRLEHERELEARLEQAEESFNQEREGLIQSSSWTEEKVRGLTQELEQFHQEQLKSLVERHALEKEELRKELLEKHQRELQEGRGKMETEYARRLSQIEAQFQADCHKVTERCENALQSLEGRHRQELKELLEQQREEKSQWEFEKDELTQECAEAQEQLKESLEREKATSLVLTQEREMLEKTYKEHVNSMVIERQQLLQDLEDLRNVSQSQQSLLSGQILELQSNCDRELRDHKQVLFRAGTSEQLERIQMECDQERQEMRAKLLAMESLHKMTCEKADRERAEMSTEISRLQHTIKEMRQAASSLSKLQSGCQAVGGVEAEGSGAMSLLQQGEQLLEENGDVLVSLQRAHERAVKENVKMATEISRLQQRLQKLEPGSVMSSCLDESTTGFSGNSMEQTQSFLLENRMKQVEGVTTPHTLSDLQDDEVGDPGSTGTSSVQRQEVKIEESEASMESFSELENSEETRTASWDLKNQIRQLQEQLRSLRADCDRASEKKQDLLFDVSVLKKKLKILERIPEASSKYKLLYEDASRENDCLQEELRAMETRYEEALENNKELTAEVFRLQDELKKVEEVTETFLSLEKSYDEVKTENEELNSSTLVSSLEAELSEVKIQTHIVEQENLLLKDELEKMKQVRLCPDLSEFQRKISSVLSYNEKLLKEKEALSEELNSCVDKLAKSSLLEHRIATMKQEQKSWEHQSESLKSQLAASQEKNWSPEVTTHPSGFQNQQKRLSWDKLDHQMNEEQQLLWQENERLQTVVQNTKAELAHSLEKVRQLESNLLPPKHQKHLNPSGTVKPTEQEKLSLKRECEQFQKERSPANRKISQVNSLERELETIHLENEGLKKKQVKLDEQLMEMQHLRSTVMLSPSPHAWDLQLLQQQACPMVPREQFLQLQHQLLQAERTNQHLQEELENRTSDTNMPQENQEQLVSLMEERMIEVEQKLKLVKRLLQEKVNQLREQLVS